MKPKTLQKKLSCFSIFSEKSLILLVSVVTFLLQLISFVTTWHGSKIYLEGIFPYASLLFAVAIQATAYFFSNSLRQKAGVLKLLALGIALCCSTYYSYIGIYNSVNSPITYLQERYVTISNHMTQLYEQELDHSLVEVQDVINDASSMVITEYTKLSGISQNITACRISLSEIQVSYADNMRAPNRYSYENYEDYAAAYQAYINTISQSNNTENDALRSQTLSSYGYPSIDALNEAERQNLADLNALQTSLGMSIDDDIANVISTISADLTTAITNARTGIPFTATNTSNLNKLLQAARLCGYSNTQTANISATINACAHASSTALMKDYNQLIINLPARIVTDANTMSLKGLMDAEILSASLKLNALLPAHAQISLLEPTYEITDLYLLPMKSLTSTDTQLIALFCLLMAALVDALSVLFALSIRPRKALWKRHSLTFCKMEDYETMIYASLPQFATPAKSLESFLSYFKPSPQTEHDGYMLQADLNDLRGYNALAAFLCQVNLAKIIPAGYRDNPTDCLLLKARFVFWTNTIIYQEKKEALYE